MPPPPSVTQCHGPRPGPPNPTREADAAINHIVKNMMAEAAGLTEVFLDVCVPGPRLGPPRR